MPAPRKPTELHVISGSIAHNPKRYADRADEFKNDRPLGEPPERMTELQRQAWAEVSAALPDGVIGFTDRLSLEVLSVLLARFWESGADMHAAHMARMDSLLGRFGMTPADRSRVKVGVKKESNPFSGHGKRPS